MAKMCYRPVLGSTVNGLEQPFTVSNSNNSISSEISHSNANAQSMLPLSNEHETNDYLDHEFLIAFSNRENNQSNLVTVEDNLVNIYNANPLSNSSLDINQSNNFVAASSANNHYNEFELYNSSSYTISTYPSWFQSNGFGYPNLNNYYQQYNQQFSNSNDVEMDRDDQQVNPGSVSNPNQQILYPLYCDAPQSSVSSIDWSPNGSNLSANDVFENTELITPINNYLKNNNKVHNESKPITVLPKKRETRTISRNSMSIAQNATPMISNTGYYNMPARPHSRNVYHIYDYVMEIFYNPREIARRIRAKDPNKLKELEDQGLEIDKLFLWLDPEKGIFKVLQPEFVAFIWAFIKKNQNWSWKRFLKSIQLHGDFKIASKNEGYGKWHVLKFNRRI